MLALPRRRILTEGCTTNNTPDKAPSQLKILSRSFTLLINFTMVTAVEMMKRGMMSQL